MDKQVSTQRTVTVVHLICCTASRELLSSIHSRYSLVLQTDATHSLNVSVFHFRNRYKFVSSFQSQNTLHSHVTEKSPSI